MPASKSRRLARAASAEPASASEKEPSAAAVSTAWDDDDDDSQGALAAAPATDGTKERRHGSFAERISCTLFVGQLPYSATAADIRRHFKASGVVGGVQVRLRTERDGTSKGTAFVEFDSESDVHTALRLHHSAMNGRRINVERTVGGGGAVEKRKEKLTHLREIQGHQMKETISNLIKTVLPPSAEAAATAKAQGGGKGKGGAGSWGAADDADEGDGHVPVTQADVDERVRDFLSTIPTPLAEEALREAKALHMGGIRNRAAYLMGVLKRKVAESDRLKQQHGKSSSWQQQHGKSSSWQQQPAQRGEQRGGGTKRARATDQGELRPPREQGGGADEADEAAPKPKQPKKPKKAQAEDGAATSASTSGASAVESAPGAVPGAMSRSASTSGASVVGHEAKKMKGQKLKVVQVEADTSMMGARAKAKKVSVQ